jgi:hypothetical protein
MSLLQISMHDVKSQGFLRGEITQADYSLRSELSHNQFAAGWDHTALGECSIFLLGPQSSAHDFSYNSNSNNIDNGVYYYNLTSLFSDVVNS